MSLGFTAPAQSARLHFSELPGRVFILSANPSLSFSVSKIPTNAVKKALPKTIAFPSLLESNAI